MRLILTAVLAVQVTQAAAQRPARPRQQIQPEIQQEVRPEDRAYADRLRLAESFLGAAQIERAIAMLEDLLTEQPHDAYAIHVLKGAYEAVKRYDDAIALVDRTLEQSLPSGALPHKADRARLLHLSGRQPEALEAWHSVLDEATLDERVYRLVYESMMEVRLIDPAIEILERARNDLVRPDLFQADLAYLHSLVGAHDKAMHEYLALLSANERQLGYVRGRLGQSLQQEGAMEASLPIIEAHVAAQPAVRSFRELLAWMLVESAQYAEALQQYRLLSQGEEHPGRTLFAFAMQAADMAEYQVAASAFEEVLANHPDAQVVADAKLGLARMHRLHGERLAESAAFEAARPLFEAAVEAYRAFLAEFPGHPEHAEVLRSIGDVQQHVFLELGEAERTLQEVVQRFPGTHSAQQARFDLGRLAVDRDDLETARTIFELLELDLGRYHALAARARHERAMIHFYRGDLASAATLAAEARQQPTTDVANDAIELRVLLLQNPGPDSANAALQQFGAASLLLRQRRAVEAIDAADAVLGYWGQHPVADDVRFLRARALFAAGRHEDALLAFAELALAHPDSPLADRSLFRYASILDRELGRAAEALKAYTDLLTRYPASLRATKARERIRGLREKEGA